MSQAPERVKQSTEKRTLSFDFTTKLKAGDSVNASPAPAVTATPSGLVIGTPSLAGNVVSVQISGGVDRSGYDLSCNVTTTPGADILELDAAIWIRDTEN